MFSSTRQEQYGLSLGVKACMVQTKGRVKGGRLSTDSPKWLVLYGSIKQLYKLTNIYTAKKEMSFFCHLILEKYTDCVKV